MLSNESLEHVAFSEEIRERFFQRFVGDILRGISTGILEKPWKQISRKSLTDFLKESLKELSSHLWKIFQKIPGRVLNFEGLCFKRHYGRQRGKILEKVVL